MSTNTDSPTELLGHLQMSPLNSGHLAELCRILVQKTGDIDLPQIDRPSLRSDAHQHLREAMVSLALLDTEVTTHTCRNRINAARRASHEALHLMPSYREAQAAVDWLRDCGALDDVSFEPAEGSSLYPDRPCYMRWLISTQFEGFKALPFPELKKRISSQLDS